MEGSHDRDGIVIEDSGDIFRGKFICRVADEEACFSYSTITDHHTPVYTLAPLRSLRQTFGAVVRLWHRQDRTDLIVATTILTARAIS